MTCIYIYIYIYTHVYIYIYIYIYLFIHLSFIYCVGSTQIAPRLSPRAACQRRLPLRIASFANGIEMRTNLSNYQDTT